MKKFFEWALTNRTRFFPHQKFTEAVLHAVRAKGLLPVPAQSLEKSKGVIEVYQDPDRRAVVDLVHCVKQEVPFLLTPAEAYQLAMCCRQALKTDGELAEVGVYNGGSAKLICEVKGDRPLHLFDTFTGLPNTQAIDRSHFKDGEYSADLEQVKGYLSAYPKLFFYPGIFPQTATPVADKHFCFVNLDVDVYQSTKDCLEFFYPRMNPAGVILSDDYNFAPGVKKAFDEFFASRPEPIIEMLGSQCLIVKV